MAILTFKSSIEFGAGFEYLFIASYFLLVSAEALIYDFLSHALTTNAPLI